MQSTRKTIIVTGCNQGIGYTLVQKLAEDPQWHILMACRNSQAAQASRQKIVDKFPNALISVEILDLSDTNSILAFTETIKSKYAKIDVLVNNGAIYIRQFEEQSRHDVFRQTFQTNFYGQVTLVENLIGHINKNGKIINFASMLGRFANFTNYPEILAYKNKKFSITAEEFINFAKSIQKAAPQFTAQQIYSFTKVAINLYTVELSRRENILAQGIQVYSLCPGYVSTNMTKYLGVKTVEQGIQTPYYLVSLPFQINQEYQGKFFSEKTVTEF